LVAEASPDLEGDHDRLLTILRVEESDDVTRSYVDYQLTMGFAIDPDHQRA
jgi:hypothetical protein